MNDLSSIPHADLLAEIEAHLERTNMSKSEFGKQAVNDPRFVFDLIGGRECRRATIQAVRDFMASTDA